MSKNVAASADQADTDRWHALRQLVGMISRIEGCNAPSEEFLKREFAKLKRGAHGMTVSELALFVDRAMQEFNEGARKTGDLWWFTATEERSHA